MGNGQIKEANRRSSSRRGREQEVKPANPFGQKKKKKQLAPTLVLPTNYCRTPKLVFTSKDGGGTPIAPTSVVVIKDDIHVADHHNSQVCVYSVDGEFKMSYTLPGKPQDMALIGNKVVITVDTKKVLVHDTETNTTSEFKGQAELNLQDPRGVTTDSAGLLYICNHGNNTVQVFDQSGTVVRSIGHDDSGKMEEPESVAVHPVTGEVYVTSKYFTHYRRVNVYNHEGVYKSMIDANKIPGSDNFLPHSLTFRQDGMLCVTDFASNAVHILNDGHRYVHRLGKKGEAPGSFCKPSGSAFTEDGKLVVLDWENNRIQIFIDVASNEHVFVKK